MSKASLVLVLVLLLGGSAAARSATAPAAPGGAITAAQARQTLTVLQDPQQREHLIETLQTIAKAGALAPSPAAAATAAAPPSTTDLGGRVLTQISDGIVAASGEVVAVVTTVTHFRLLWRALVQLLSDPARQAVLIDACWRLLLILACGLAAEWLTQQVLRRPLRRLMTAPQTSDDGGPRPDPAPAAAPPAAAQGEHPRLQFIHARRVLGRLPPAMSRLVLDLLPVAAFGAVSVIVLGTRIGASETIRLVILAVVDAYLLLRGVMCVTRMLVSPSSHRLRLVWVGDAAAARIEHWVRRVMIVAAFGGALVEIAARLGMNDAGRNALVRLVGLAVDLMLVVMVVRSRRAVAQRIRDRRHPAGGLALARDHLAEVWHYLAVFLLIALWVVWAIEVRDGFSHALYFAAASFAVVVGARLASLLALAGLARLLGANGDGAHRPAGLEERKSRYFPLLRGLVAISITAAGAIVLLEVWGVDAFDWFAENGIGRPLASATITVVIATAVAIIIWEVANAAIDRHLAQLTSAGQAARTARLRTLLPFLRTTLFLVVLTIIGLTALSEVGINIGPLLAGAGIVGIAVGFGAQKLVQDVITGLFLLLENAMQVGDWVTVGTLSGSVESLSIRTLWLRGGDGSVHVIPFSSVTSLTNTNRGVGNAAVSVNVALTEDTDHVGEVLKGIAAAMRQEPDFKAMMLSDLQLWGVDKVDAALATIVGQIVCTASGRWGVQREFNRRLKKRFEELGIEIANPTQTIVLRTPERAADAPRADAAAASPPEPRRSLNQT